MEYAPHNSKYYLRSCTEEPSDSEDINLPAKRVATDAAAESDSAPQSKAVKIEPEFNSPEWEAFR
jgi:hypothetical protein